MNPKFTKGEVHFERPAKGAERCGNCIHFNKDSSSCDIVEGAIYYSDWCNQFSKKVKE